MANENSAILLDQRVYELEDQIDNIKKCKNSLKDKKNAFILFNDNTSEFFDIVTGEFLSFRNNLSSISTYDKDVLDSFLKKNKVKKEFNISNIIDVLNKEIKYLNMVKNKISKEF